VIGIRAGYSNTAWIDFITTDDQCGGVHFKLAERLWGSILTMKRANVSQEPAWKRNFMRKPLRPAADRGRLQLACRRLFVMKQTISTSDVIKTGDETLERWRGCRARSGLAPIRRGLRRGAT
jgi:hypothetical protein